ncbi:MAG: hypothetical protein HOC74_37575 [Gemmatimonadetes bacterium]|nr:hypothetical protein [Gemmatimonadota bacterium]
MPNHPKYRRRLLPFILASFILHLLMLVAYQRWAARQMEELLHPVRFQIPLPAPERFRPKLPAFSLPAEIEWERLESDAPRPEEEAWEDQTVEELPPDVPPTSLGTWGLFGEKGEEYAGQVDSTLSMNEMDREAMRRRGEALARYRRRWLPDADTADAESRRRRLAEEIVDRAIEAMGGLKRMQVIRNKKAEVSYWDWRGQKWTPASEVFYAGGRKFMEKAGGGRTRGLDGDSAWAYVYGMPVPAGRLSMEHQAERWDFLSQYKGHEILLDYVRAEKLPGERVVDRILVEDLKYGTFREAIFARDTHLLVATVENGARKEVQEYREVEDILTPYEIWTHQGPRVNKHRHDTEYNLDLAGDFFGDPGPRTWDTEAMNVLLRQDPVAPRTVRLDGVTQVITGWKPNGAPIDEIATPGTRRLLDFYLAQKLKAAEMWSDEAPDYQVSVTIKGYYQTVGDPPRFAIHLLLILQTYPRYDSVGERMLTHTWKGGGIDGKKADDLTSILADAIGEVLETATEEGDAP